MNTEGTGSNEPIESNVSLGGILGGGSPAVQTPIIPPVVPATDVIPTGDTPPPPPPLTTGNPPETFDTSTFEGLVASFNSDGISTESKDIRETLLTTFKANRVDSKGNLLNSNNEIVLSADKLEKYIDTNELPLDAQGNAINDKGEVLQTSAELADANSLIIPIKSALETNFGIQLPVDLELPDTEEGIIKLVSEVVKAKSTNTVINFLDANPELKGFYQHIALGGKPEGYTSSNIDYKGINIKTLDEGAKLQLLAKSFTLQGTPNKDNLIELIKKSGEEELNKATAGAVLFLDTKQTEFNQTREADLLAASELEEQNTEKYWQGVKTVVDKGTLNNINIPVTDREGFFNYMSKPINANYDSAESVDATKDSLEFQLLVSYLRYKKGDISKLASIIATDNRVSTLKDRLNNLNRRNDNGVPRTGSNSNSGKPSGGLSLDGLLG